MKIKGILNLLFWPEPPNILCQFDESETVLSLPRWFVRRFGPWIPQRLLLRIAPFIPHWDNSRKGLYVAAPHATTISQDRRHCLTYVREWGCFVIHRAKTDLQRYGWHGITVDNGTHYRGQIKDTMP